jgi:hypothetical protein
MEINTILLIILVLAVFCIIIQNRQRKNPPTNMTIIPNRSFPQPPPFRYGTPFYGSGYRIGYW